MERISRVLRGKAFPIAVFLVVAVLIVVAVTLGASPSPDDAPRFVLPGGYAISDILSLTTGIVAPVVGQPWLWVTIGSAMVIGFLVLAYLYGRKLPTSKQIASVPEVAGADVPVIPPSKQGWSWTSRWRRFRSRFKRGGKYD